MTDKKEKRKIITITPRIDLSALKEEVAALGTGLKTRAQEVLGITEEDRRDAERYRRLRILGASPYGRRDLLRFDQLDSFLDEDLRVTPSRGEKQEPR